MTCAAQGVDRYHGWRGFPLEEVEIMAALTDDKYVLLFTVRYAVRHFLRWSERQAELAGVTAQQHQLLLALRAREHDGAPSIGELAGYLMVRPNSALELVGRVEAQGLVRRRADGRDHRVVRVVLTATGRELIEALADAHLRELEVLGDQLHVSERFLGQLAGDFIADSFGLAGLPGADSG